MSVCVCVCSLSYPARNAYVTYYIVVCGQNDFTTLFYSIS